MLRVLPRTRDFTDLQRLLAIVTFTVLIILSAQVKIPLEPVPFTMQPLVVILAGMVLGGRDGALAMFAYVSLIALGFPVDANAKGTTALFGPTGGFLVGFIAAAGVVGLIVENLPNTLPEAIRARFGDKVAGMDTMTVYQFVTRFIAGLVGLVVIYAFGIVVLRNVQASLLDMDVTWNMAWDWAGRPFFGLDLIKVVLAAGLTETGRHLLLRQWGNEKGVEL